MVILQVLVLQEDDTGKNVHQSCLVTLQVVEVLPADVAERMELQPAVLQAGKATCVLAARSRHCLINVQLMDVLDLQLSM